jgi:cytochrome c oxidase accessory protein FixG
VANSRKVIPIEPAIADDGEFFSLYESHQKIYPRTVKGRFATLRWLAVFFTQLLFYGLPWLNWNGRQAVLFDLGARKFYLFGLILWPQDFIYLAALLVIAALSLFFFTAVAGRLWCGYACPQTVYTEIFMWVERRFEGDRASQMKLDAAPWSAAKIGKKAGKHAVWLLIALFTGFTFIAYFTPIRTLAGQILSLQLGGWGLFWWLFYSVATWGNAGFMREQVCKYMCPYARFQGAMFDKDTLIVTYDAQRGEPRGSRGRKVIPAEVGLGSCIDCGLCVDVCPTGIDIRKGQQYECIGCAACIDVCDAVMVKMNRDRTLSTPR